MDATVAHVQAFDDGPDVSARYYDPPHICNAFQVPDFHSDALQIDVAAELKASWRNMVPRRCLRRAIAELKNILAQFAPTPALRRVEMALELGQ